MHILVTHDINQFVQLVAESRWIGGLLQYGGRGQGLFLVRDKENKKKPIITTWECVEVTKN